jgi:hypothetical protein
MEELTWNRFQGQDLKAFLEFCFEEKIISVNSLVQLPGGYETNGISMLCLPTSSSTSSLSCSSLDRPSYDALAATSLCSAAQVS